MLLVITAIIRNIKVVNKPKYVFGKTEIVGKQSSVYIYLFKNKILYSLFFIHLDYDIRMVFYCSDLLGLFHHQMIHYHNIILSIIPNNYTQRLDRGNFLVSEKTTIKKTAMIVVGTVEKGVAAYLSL